jgi:hypothetical protein
MTHINQLLGKLEEHRQNALNYLLEEVMLILARFDNEKPTCSETCSAVLLGALRRGLGAAGYLPKVLHNCELLAMLPLQDLYDILKSIKMKAPACPSGSPIEKSRLRRPLPRPSSMYASPPINTMSEDHNGCSIQKKCCFRCWTKPRKLILLQSRRFGKISLPLGGAALLRKMVVQNMWSS